MSSGIPEHLKAAFIAWARSKGIRKPHSQETLDILFARFMIERAAAPSAPVLGGEVLGADRLGISKNPIEVTWDGAKSEIFDVRTHAPDDFDVMVEKREAAMIEAGHDDLAREAILMEQGAAAAAAAAPPSSTNPVSATNTPLGGQATPDSTKPPVEVARWVGDDREATNFTITASFVQPPQSAGVLSGIGGRSYLIVQWGCRGVANSMEVDVGNGCEFTLTGSFVSVSVAYDGRSVNGATQGQPVAVSLAFRDGNRTTPLTRTKIFNSVGNVAGQLFLIPPFAKQFFVIPTTITATCEIILQEADGFQIIDFTQGAGGLPLAPYPMPANAYQMFVKPSATCPVTVIFYLSV